MEEQNEIVANVTEVTEVESAVTDENSFGRFKDLKSLLKAYDNLQSEFTRRCQKSKLLEKEYGLLKEENANLKERFQKQEGEEKDVKGHFLNKYPDASNFLNSFIASVGDNEVKFDEMEKSYINSLKDEISSLKSNFKSEDILLSKVHENPMVKDSIIKSYIEELEGSKPKVKLSMGVGVSVTAPPLKPKSIQDAGHLALQYLENKEYNN